MAERFQGIAEAADSPIAAREGHSRIATIVTSMKQFALIRITTHRDGDDAIIAISDSGGGIPEPIRERIVDRHHVLHTGADRWRPLGAPRSARRRLKSG